MFFPKLTYRRMNIFIIVLFMIVIGGFVAYLQHPEPSAFVTAPVKRGNIENAILATGRLDAIDRVNVGAQVSGQVKLLKVHVGDRVMKNEVVAEIDDVPQRSALRTAEAAVNVLQSRQMAKRLQMHEAELRFRRLRQMLKSGAVSQEGYENAKTAFSITAAELDELNAQQVQAQIEVDRKKADLAYTRVLAPMDGIVIAVVTQQGQTVNANQSAPTIIKLARLDVMTIKAQISEADITRVFPGQKGWFTIFSEPDKRYDAILRTVELAPESIMKEDAAISNANNGSSASGSGSSSASVYYNALMDVPNPDNSLRIAMTAQVSLLCGEAKNVLLVPIQAVKKGTDKKTQVQVLHSGGRLETRDVTTGITNNLNVEITHGLKEGEKVILSQPAQNSAGEDIYL